MNHFLIGFCADCTEAHNLTSLRFTRSSGVNVKKAVCDTCLNTYTDCESAEALKLGGWTSIYEAVTA